MLLATDLLEINLYLNQKHFSLPSIFQREIANALGMELEEDGSAFKISNLNKYN